MILIILLISLALLICNATYCAAKMIYDFKRVERASGVWGLLAFTGSLIALSGFVSALLASLAHL
ncbi:hypothetical protein DM806_14345 [Sphingobium lactosutens]|uniref:hypothetical protein n=1 Tax=Sphingobium lactosutens TaxID=522773 RepID=UPI0015C0EEA2|nr:hypothetical protein [Sphingobium lactosutens]NWK96821.1 hypothetical protein [Sphingobium lactosutens]